MSMVSAVGVLRELALDHPGGEVREEPDDPVVPRAQGEADGLDEEKVPEKDRDIGPPNGVHRRPPAPGPGVVDDVVVDEARRMDDLDDGGKVRRVRAGISRNLRAQQEKGRPQALARFLEEIAPQIGDEGIGRGGPGADVRFDLVHSVPDAAANLGEEGGAPAGLGTGPFGIERRHRKFVNCMWIPRSLDLRKAMTS
jgi:hypothetical protein